MENDYQKLIFSAETKATIGGYEGAKDDLIKASELGKKLGKNPTEVDNLIEEANKRIAGQEKEDISAKYDFDFPPLGDHRIVRLKSNGRIGVIDASGKEIIPCIYITTSIRGNNRAFIKEDNTEDIYDKNGIKLLPSISDTSNP